jgi:tetratricopeptide (TPR) repeat protein
MAVHHKNFWYYKGRALYKEKKYEEANACFDEALTENSEHYLTWNKKGMALYRQKKFKEAIPCFDEAIRLKPFVTSFKDWKDNCNVSIWEEKGRALYRQKKFKEAIPCFDEAIRWRPETHSTKKLEKWKNDCNILILCQKSAELCTQKKFKEANTYIDEAIVLDSEFFDLWIVKTMIMIALQRHPEFFACKEEAKRIDPKRFNEFLTKHDFDEIF